MPSLQPHVSTTQVGTHTARSSATDSTAQAGTHADPRAGRGPLPKPRLVVLPVINLGQAKPAGPGHIHNADSDLMHHQRRLSVLIQAQRAGTPPTSSQRLADGFMRKAIPLQRSRRQRRPRVPICGGLLPSCVVCHGISDGGEGDNRRQLLYGFGSRNVSPGDCLNFHISKTPGSRRTLGSCKQKQS